MTSRNKRRSIVVVELPAEDDGFGIVVEPFPPPQPAEHEFPMQRQLAEALSHEWSSAILEKGVVELRSRLDVQINVSDELGDRLNRGQDLLQGLGEKLSNVMREKADTELKIGQVELSNRIAESRLAKLEALAARLTADLEVRQAENAVLVHDAKTDRDAAKAEEEKLRAEAVKIVERSVETKRQADGFVRKLDAILESRSAAKLTLERALEVFKGRERNASERKASARRAAEEAERCARESEGAAAEAGRAAEAARRDAEAARRDADNKRYDLLAAERALEQVSAAIAAERTKLAAAQGELGEARTTLALTTEEHRVVLEEVVAVQGHLNASGTLLAGLRGALNGAASQMRSQAQEALDGIEAALWDGMGRLQGIRGSL
jgi:chromosome segregation ATPase